MRTINTTLPRNDGGFDLVHLLLRLPLFIVPITYAGDADGDGFVETYAYQGEELSVFCGCSFPSSSPSNPSAPTPSPFTPAPTPSGHDICGEGGSVSVISESLPEAAGCLFSTTTTLDGYALYTSDGTDDEEQLWMYDLEITREDSSTAVSLTANLYFVKRAFGRQGRAGASAQYMVQIFVRCGRGRRWSSHPVLLRLND